MSGSLKKLLTTKTKPAGFTVRAGFGFKFHLHLEMHINDLNEVSDTPPDMFPGSFLTEHFSFYLVTTSSSTTVSLRSLTFDR